jgi:predicted transcriptional regulator
VSLSRPAPTSLRNVTELQRTLASWVLSSGISQVELARRTGFSTKHVNQMLRGGVEGTLSAWQALLDAAGIRVRPPESD